MRHLSAAVDKFDYRLPYAAIFGGAVAMTARHFADVNGFSNQFWGWGGEDDDLFNRVAQAGLPVTRYKADVARWAWPRGRGGARRGAGRGWGSGGGRLTAAW